MVDLKNELPSCNRCELYNLLCIHLHLNFFHPHLVRFCSEPVPIETRLIPLGLSQLELAYFLLGLGWTCFRADLVGTETWDDKNTSNGDGEDTCRKVYEIELKINKRENDSNILKSLFDKGINDRDRNPLK